MSGTGTRKLRHAVALWAALSAAGCRATTNGEAQPDTAQAKATPSLAASASLPEVVLSPPGQQPVKVAVEVVQTDQARQRGLMYRKHLAQDAGMLFIFEREEPHTFWMHNTLIPLDMIFIKSDWTILGIVENAEPLTDTLRSVPGESQYVLEVNAGFSRSHGLQAGTRVQYSPEGHGS